MLNELYVYLQAQFPFVSKILSATITYQLGFVKKINKEFAYRKDNKRSMKPILVILPTSVKIEYICEIEFPSTMINNCKIK